MRNFFLVICAASFFIAGCHNEVVPPKPPVVKVQQIAFTEAADEEIYSGVVRGRYELNLSFQVGEDFLLKFRGGDFT